MRVYEDDCEHLNEEIIKILNRLDREDDPLDPVTIYAVLSLILCKTALFDGLSIDGLVKGLRNTYKTLESDHEQDGTYQNCH